MENRFTEFVFENQDLTADRGLGNMQLLAGARERTGFSDRANDFQLPQVHQEPLGWSAYMRARHESTSEDSFDRWAAMVARALPGCVRSPLPDNLRPSRCQ